ncbi:Usp17lb, partial [Symbiodinium sp. KB8]
MLDILVLQEVAGLQRIQVKTGSSEAGASLKEYAVGDESELYDYRIFGSIDTDSYLGQVIVLDEDIVDHVTSTKSGRRCIEVSFVHQALQCACFVLGCHLPHKSSGDDLFHEALLELEGACHRAISSDFAVFAGDWNCQSGDERFLQLTALLHSKHFTVLYPESDTWFGFNTSRRYDFFFVKIGQAIQHLEDHDSLDVSVNTQAMQELGCDHALVGVQLLLAHRSPKRPRKQAPRRSACRKAQVLTDALPHAIHTLILPHLHGTLKQQWNALQRLSGMCCVSRPSLKFRDSDHLKALCALKRGTRDSSERSRLGRVILAIRAHEKLEWWKHLESLAGQGHSEAIGYLKRRAQLKANDTNLVLAQGSKLKAAESIQAHFRRVLASASQGEMDRCSQLLGDLHAKASQCELLPISPAEVRAHVCKYSHDRKTSGMSGIPNELLAALSRDEDGISFLCNHLTMMLSCPQAAPEDYVRAFVCLIPKKPDIKLPSDLRPIALLESTLKLCSGLLFRRWVARCRIPQAQKGALPGCQTLSALFLAQQLLYVEYKTAKPGLWLLVDVAQAFDSLRRSRILEYLISGPPELSKEAAALFEYLKSYMVFHWGGHAWTELTSTGIQQGSPPSAGLFALILGEALDALFCSWDTHENIRARHRDAMGRPLHGWAFADDCILNFLGWSDYKKGFSSLLLAFQELGLSINLSKTYLIVHPSLLEDGLAYFRDDPDHPGFRCKWVQEGLYLRKPFKHFVGATNLSDWALSAARALSHAGWETLAAPAKCCNWSDVHTALGMVNRYIFSKWAWFGPMFEPLQYVLDAIGVMNCTMLLLMLKLYLPSDLAQAKADLVLSVPTEEQVKAAGSIPTTQALLEDRLKFEELDADCLVNCDRCQDKRQMGKWCEIVSPPCHICICLNRFTFNVEKMDFTKEKTPVRVDGPLKIGPYEYELYHVIIHTGKDASSGHYYAVGRRSEPVGSGDTSWYTMDDSQIKPAELGLLQGNPPEKLKDDNPYVLFYRCKNAPSTPALRIPKKLESFVKK